MQLAKFLSKDKVLQLLQSSWAAVLNPIIADPSNNSNLLVGVKLANGTTAINHKLGRKMQGWEIADVDAAAKIYRAPSEPLNDVTLTLVSDAACTVILRVY